MKNSDIGVHDPIEEGFAVMVDASKRFCRGRNSPDDLCFIYHRLWPYMRRIGFHPWRHAWHFVNSLLKLRENGRPTRVLISGSADYSLLAWVLHALRAPGSDPEITVLDICEAPLVVNRWYADRLDAEIATVACDILKYQSDSAFDVITTSNFLIRFEEGEKSRVLARWRDLLRPGGKVVSVQNISNDSPIGKETFDAHELERKCARVLARANENISLIDISPETLATYYQDYVVTRSLFRHRTKDDLKTFFEDSGFRMDTAMSLSNQEQCDRAKLKASRRHHDAIRFVATKSG